MSQPITLPPTLTIATVRNLLRRANLPLMQATRSKQNRAAFSTTDGYRLSEDGFGVIVEWSEANFIRPHDDAGWAAVLNTRATHLQTAQTALQGAATVQGQIVATLSEDGQRLTCVLERPASQAS